MQEKAIEVAGQAAGQAVEVAGQAVQAAEQAAQVTEQLPPGMIEQFYNYGLPGLVALALLLLAWRKMR